MIHYEYKSTWAEYARPSPMGLTPVPDPRLPRKENDSVDPDWELASTCADGRFIIWTWRRPCQDVLD